MAVEDNPPPPPPTPTDKIIPFILGLNLMWKLTSPLPILNGVNLIISSRCRSSDPYVFLFKINGLDSRFATLAEIIRHHEPLPTFKTDFLTRHILLRCDSSGDLYPVIKSSNLPVGFVYTSSSTWHQRLGHPGDEVLRSLTSHHFISCNKEESAHVCMLVNLTPVDIDSKLRPDGVPVQDPTLYRSLAGALGTLKLSLHLYASATTSLVGYTDVDWVGCPFTRSAEAKYRGVANVVAEAAWLRNLLRELHSPLLTAKLVYCDNAGYVRVLHVPSRFQYADIFTKGLPSALFEDFRSSLSVRPPPTQTTRAYYLAKSISCLILIQISINQQVVLLSFIYSSLVV
nr:hypothetical protein [Tanacetum cinerariifolium]